ncbi:MAG: hypothetical protein K8H88_28565 [Sandaracinaceae bacterium]|nr:hypothetical protein [Sandaracinaceae bacterium]
MAKDNLPPGWSRRPRKQSPDGFSYARGDGVRLKVLGDTKKTWYWVLRADGKKLRRADGLIRHWTTAQAAMKAANAELPQTALD